MQLANLTEEQILRLLMEQAEVRFGKERAEQLRAELQRAAAEIVGINRFPLELQDGP